MWITDFEYASRHLSEFDCMVVAFDGGAGFITKSAPARQFNTVMNNATYRSTITSTKYNENYTFTIQIGKKNCSGDYIFTVDEIRRLIRWLDRRDFKKFKLVEESGLYHDVFFMGTFNSTPVMDGDDIVGLNCVFTADAPFGYGEEERFEIIVSKENIDNKNDYLITDSSDDYGYHDMDMQITITSSSGGDLIIACERDGVTTETIVKSCAAGEVINFDSKHKIITATRTDGQEHPRLYNDFNWEFPRVVRTEDFNSNKFTFSLPVNVVAKFNPIRKVMVL